MKNFVKGFKVIKFDYTQMTSREIILKLSPDYSIFKWEYENKPNFLSIFKKRQKKISTIQSMMFGPISQTFMSYRLQILLNLPKENNTKEDSTPAFYGWECLSLKLPNRTFDIVIKD